MNDVEGIRNLIGTGLVDFAGGILTALLSMAVMIRISPMLTGMALAVVTYFPIYGLMAAFAPTAPALI